MRTVLIPARMILICIIALAILVTGSAQESEEGERRLNEPPVVNILWDPPEEAVPYRLTLSWEGSDPDGSLDHFQYTISPSSVFTEGEIAHPETSPGLTLEWTHSELPGRGRLRVEKIVDGRPYAYYWHQTPDTEELLKFVATNPESVDINGTLYPTNRSVRDHRFYLRGVDNQETISLAPDRVDFQVYTLNPVSEITQPEITQEVYTAGRNLLIEWEGIDPDAEFPEHIRISRYKLVRLDTLNPPLDPEHPIPTDVFYRDLIWNWDYASSATLELQVPGAYAFTVLVQDEAGANEQSIEWGRNAFKIVTEPPSGEPLLEFSEPLLGHHLFEKDEILEGWEIPRNLVLEGEVFCNADAYGGRCEGMRWGVDMPDPYSDERWGSWTSFGSLPLIRFDTAGPHSFSLQVRDADGNRTTATFRFNVVDVPLERDVLYVDDSFDDTFPRDDQHDAFWRGLMQSVDGVTFDEFHVHGEGDRESLIPTTPSLAVLGQYRLVIWENRGSGYAGRSGLLDITDPGNALAAYLRAGGKLWLGGRMTMAAMDRIPGLNQANFSYPKSIFPDSFAWDFLKLQNWLTQNDKGLDSRNTLLEAIPFPGNSPVFERMQVDREKLNLAQRLQGGVTHADVLFDPVFDEQPDARGITDSLYAYGAAGDIDLSLPSQYHNRLIGHRWHDPDPARKQGRVMWFGFPLYYFQESDAQETFRRAINWFKEETPVPVRLTYFYAERVGESALIRWGVGAREDHAGFHVYRSDPLNGERKQVTRSLISGRERYEFEDSEAPGESTDYWLAEISRDGETVWHGPRTLRAADVTPRLVTLSPAWPNPFSDRTRIAYTVVEESPVTLTVFDVQGRQVAVLVNETQPAGRYEIPWNARRDDGSTAAAGMYIIRLTAGGEARIQKTILTR